MGKRVLFALALFVIAIALAGCSTKYQQQLDPEPAAQQGQPATPPAPSQQTPAPSTQQPAPTQTVPSASSGAGQQEPEPEAEPGTGNPLQQPTAPEIQPSVPEPEPIEPGPEIAISVSAPSTAQARRNVEVKVAASYEGGLSEVQVNFKGAGVEGISTVKVADCGGEGQCSFTANNEYAQAGTYTIVVQAISSDFNVESVSKTIRITEAELQ